MDEMEQALRELERLQGIIDRHEGHTFTLRGWLVTVMGALVAAYYAENIHMSDVVMRVALPVVALLFIVMEMRHINLVEAVVERALELEDRIVARRQLTDPEGPWYDGPKVSRACEEGVNRLWPRHGMTLVLYQPVYVVIFAIIIFAIVWLPPKESAVPPQQGQPSTVQPQTQP